MLIQTITAIRNKGMGDGTSVAILLKQVLGKLDDDTMPEVKHLMSYIVTFHISDAIVESWGSTLDSLISNKVAFKESNTVDIVDVTEKFAFIKLVGPAVGSSAKREIIQAGFDFDVWWSGLCKALYEIISQRLYIKGYK